MYLKNNVRTVRYLYLKNKRSREGRTLVTHYLHFLFKVHAHKRSCKLFFVQNKQTAQWLLQIYISLFSTQQSTHLKATNHFSLISNCLRRYSNCLDNIKYSASTFSSFCNFFICFLISWNDFHNIMHSFHVLIYYEKQNSK